MSTLLLLGTLECQGLQREPLPYKYQVPGFISGHLVFADAIQGMPLDCLVLEMGSGGWVVGGIPGIVNNQRDSCWQTTTPGGTNNHLNHLKTTCTNNTLKIALVLL